MEERCSAHALGAKIICLAPRGEEESQNCGVALSKQDIAASYAATLSSSSCQPFLYFCYNFCPILVFALQKGSSKTTT